jgi:hypothetical protein
MHGGVPPGRVLACKICTNRQASEEREPRRVQNLKPTPYALEFWAEKQYKHVFTGYGTYLVVLQLLLASGGVGFHFRMAMQSLPPVLSSKGSSTEAYVFDSCSRHSDAHTICTPNISGVLGQF